MSVEFAIQVILKGLDHLTAPLRQVQTQMEKLGRATDSVIKLGDRMSGFGMRMAGAGLAVGAATKATLSAFTELEGAQVSAINAFSTAGGVSKFWADINEQAIQAGNLYPGTSADFINLAAAMKMAGADAEQMAAGGFKAAAAIQVMFRDFGLGPREAGSMFQTMQNAMGVAGRDALFFADQLQRLSFTAPIKIHGISEALKYAAADMKQLGIQGKESVPLVMATMGALSRGNLEDSQVGTSLGQFLNRLAIAQKKIIGGDSRGAAMRAAFEDLHKAGINFDFFDEKGKFLGMANALGQLTKLQGASEMTRSIAGKALFGTQGQRVITAASLEAVNSMIRAMRDQETLQVRLDRITGTLGASLEALGGSFRNTLAAIGEKMAPQLKKLAVSLNAILDRIGKWVDKNPELVGQLGLAAAGLAGLLISGGGAMWVIGGLATTVGKAIPLIAGLGKATWAASPWLLGLGLAGWLIYENWDTVGPVFREIGEQMGEVGRQAGALMKDVSGLVGMGGKMGKDMGIWAGAAWNLAKALQMVVTSLETMGAIFSVQKRLVVGPEGSSEWMGRMVGAFGRGKGIGGGIMEAEKERKKIVGEQGAWYEPFLRPFEKIAGRDPLGVGKAMHGEFKPAPANQTNHFTIQVQAPAGSSPEDHAEAVLGVIRQRAPEVLRMMSAHQQVATRGAY